MTMTTIKGIIARWETEGIETDRMTDFAIRAVKESGTAGGFKDRTSALALWREIAAWEFNPDTLLFLQAVASRIAEVEASQMPASERMRALGEATGLGGTVDRHRGRREYWEAIRDFSDLMEDQGIQTPSLAAIIKSNPSLWPDWGYEPTNADFDELARAVVKSYGQKKLRHFP